MKTRIKAKYPAIDYWMRKHCMTYESFANLVGIGHSTVFEFLSGRTQPTKYTIDRILKATGMTYEEAFRTDG